ncbi:MAG: hypothetical protein ACRDJC_21620 [Thermomicrobiales bacterium]
MARIEIGELRITAAADDTFWSHGLTPKQVRSILDRRWVVIRNRPDRAAPYVLIGRDEQGRCLAIPIVPTDDRFVWRPVTAWYCKPSEMAKLR